ncbi:RecX family transcriptional regulator [Fusobacterium sp.]|uniref:regulatory protein RecX n=1 Tax=Fusobacterium sp. TaxID=68766 RepID=UPI0025B9EE84|nr:RecX family transcriptional regulator [Fusobacterium sp.]MCI5725810.1 RecX family transcriptional regulator [Fusobacterium sp.]
MKISIKGNKLFLEDGQVIFLTKEMYSKFSLNNKDNLSEQEFYSLVYYRLKLSAYNMLLKRDYFKKELSNKLKEKLNFPDIIEDIMEYFSDKGYLNDFEKAQSYAKLHSNYGKNKLSYFFQQMGLDKESIHDILYNNEENEIENIKNLWLKLGNKEYNKKVASLMRKGFTYGDIKKAISSLDKEE